MSLIVSVTVKLPEPEKVCDGFCCAEVFEPPEAGSPKFHVQLFTVPPDEAVELSTNCVAKPTHGELFTNTETGGPVIVIGNEKG